MDRYEWKPEASDQPYAAVREPLGFALQKRHRNGNWWFLTGCEDLSAEILRLAERVRELEEITRREVHFEEEFQRVALVLNCWPSNFPDANNHVVREALRAMARLGFLEQENRRMREAAMAAVRDVLG